MSIQEPLFGHDEHCGKRIWGEKYDRCGCSERARRQGAGRVAPPPVLKPGQCCLRAAPMACVCAYAWQCPVHGTKHVGTHD